MFCFRILGLFWRKIAKVQKLENLGTIGLIRCNVGNPRHDVDLRQGVGYPATTRSRCQNWHPSSTPRRSIAAPRRSYCSQRAVFGFLFLKTSYSYIGSLGTLIKV